MTTMFTGKAALVTGANRGIGAAIALNLGGTFLAMRHEIPAIIASAAQS